MPSVDFSKLAAFNKDLFIGMRPAEQYQYVQERAADQDLLRQMYPHAKDDMVRFEIVFQTKDTALAERLFKNTKYPLLKARLIKYVQNKELVKNMLSEFAHQPELLNGLLAALPADEQRDFLSSLKALDVAPEHLNVELQKKIDANPFVD